MSDTRVEGETRTFHCSTSESSPFTETFSAPSFFSIPNSLHLLPAPLNCHLRSPALSPSIAGRWHGGGGGSTSSLARALPPSLPQPLLPCFEIGCPSQASAAQSYVRRIASLGAP